MKFNKKYLLAIPAFALAGFLSVSSVSAAGGGMFGGMHGGFARGMGGQGIGDPDRWTHNITQEASVLGISVDEMKTYWSQGKNLRDIAAEKGITDEQLKIKMQAAVEAKIKSQLQALVDKGHITQAQADARLTVMAQMKTKMAEHMKNRPQTKRGFKLNRPNNTGTSTTRS